MEGFVSLSVLFLLEGSKGVLSFIDVSLVPRTML